MGNSLQDQLLKAGLGNKKQAQKANSQRRKKQKQINKGAKEKESLASEQARQAKAEKLAHDKKLNQQKQEASNRKAIQAQIKQLIEMNRISRDEGEVPYNFVDEKSVRKIYVTNEILSMLGQGHLSIVKLAEEYEVIPSIVAEKISQRDSSVVISQNIVDDEISEDDPYADFKVPDDLMW